jgi:lysophospholipase L1-like esterase
MDQLILSFIAFLQGPLAADVASFLNDPRIQYILEYLANHQAEMYKLLLGVLFLLAITNELRMIILNGITNKKLAHVATSRPRILNEGQEKRILVIGDSTGYGTGADRVEDTLLGRFAHDFPHVEVNNYAVNGSVTKNLIEQIQKVHDRNYNLTIISSGGNDTWRMTDLREIERDLRTALTMAHTITGNNIALIIYNNEVSGPIFPFFIRGRILKRTRQINEIYRRVGAEFNVQTVPIFLPGEKCPENFFSRDGLHPSSEGYRIMYIRLWAVLYQYRYNYKLREY